MHHELQPRVWLGGNSADKSAILERTRPKHTMVGHETDNVSSLPIIILLCFCSQPQRRNTDWGRRTNYYRDISRQPLWTAHTDWSCCSAISTGQASFRFQNSRNTSSPGVHGQRAPLVPRPHRCTSRSGRVDQPVVGTSCYRIQCSRHPCRRPPLGQHKHRVHLTSATLGALSKGWEGEKRD